MNKVFIIAEAGVNHNGSFETAVQMVDVAFSAGADAIKFQTFKAENLVCKTAPKAVYQLDNTDNSESQLDMLKKLELDEQDYEQLVNYCNQKGIIFMSTPFDLESVELLNSLGMKIFKIPSGDITNLPLLRRIGSLDRDIIMSTGMATLGEIEASLKILVDFGTPLEKITVLHCNTEYPTPMGDVNLRAMQTIARELGVKAGYSDHTMGVEVSVAAAALGATVIEKHFTLDKGMEGPDHKASLEPEELRQMVMAIRNIEKAMGSGIKMPSHSELKNLPVARKSIVALRNIRRGEAFTEDNITVKRPGTGLSPMEWDRVLGGTAIRDFGSDELIEL